MIHLAVEHLVAQLNDYLNLRSPASPPGRVVARSLFNLDGEPADGSKDKVVVSLVNVEEDRVYHSVDLYRRRPDGVSEAGKPDIKLDLYLLFVANLSSYSEALKAIAHVVSFFQSNKAFDYSTIPSLSDHEGRLVVEMHSLSFEQQNHLWGALGAKYMPSVMYKVGLVSLRDEHVDAVVPPIEEISINE